MVVWATFFEPPPVERKKSEKNISENKNGIGIWSSLLIIIISLVALLVIVDTFKSFLITIIKDKENKENRFRRVNVRKIVSLEEIMKLNYNNVHIEIDTSDNLKKLYENIKEKGDSKIKISIVEADKKYLFELRDKRKFNYETLKNLNQEPYIKKINV